MSNQLYFQRLSEWCNIVLDYFFTNKNIYAKQLDNGIYNTIKSPVSSRIIANSIKNQDSILAYQERNGYLKWICLDIDINKERISNDIIEEDFAVLLQSTRNVHNFLSDKNISHLVEFSGNRGFHIWVFFTEPLSKVYGYRIINAIYYKSDCSEKEVIHYDLFPQTSTVNKNSKNIGKGVKIPLSKHKKSQLYSFICDINKVNCFEDMKIEKLSAHFLDEQICLLTKCTKNEPDNVINPLEIELSTEEIVESGKSPFVRVHNIHLEEPEELDNILDKIKQCNIVNSLIKDYQLGLCNRTREIMVGLLNRIETKEDQDYGKKLLREFFTRLPNFRPDITEKKLEQLSYYPLKCNYLKSQYPTLCEECNKDTPIDYIENVKIDTTSYDFSEINPDAFEKIRNSEYWYSITNDEITLYHSLMYLSNIKYDEFFRHYSSILSGEYEQDIFYYFWEREEDDKKRILSNLDPLNRILSTACLWSLNRLFNTLTFDETYSYKIAKSFYNNNIFEPWTKSWSIFINNLSDIVKNTDYDDYTIIKIDISKFYDSIDVYKLELMLLTQKSGSIDSIIDELQEKKKNIYNNIIKYLISLIKDYNNCGYPGIPQGPAFARYLSELYLYDADKMIKDFVNISDGIYLRYVDDIYIILPECNQADEIEGNISDYLIRHSLTINKEKTLKCSVREFRNSLELEKYMEKKKYIIQQYAKNLWSLPEYRIQEYIQIIFKLVDIRNKNVPNLGVLYKNKIDNIFYQPVQKEYEKYVMKSTHYRGSVYKIFYMYYLDIPGKDYFENFSEIPARSLSMIAFINEIFKRFVENNDKTLVDNLFSKIKEDPDKFENCEETIVSLALNATQKLPPKVQNKINIEMIRRIFHSGFILTPADDNDVNFIFEIIDQNKNINEYINDVYLFLINSKLSILSLSSIAKKVFYRIRQDLEKEDKALLRAISLEQSNYLYNVICFLSGYYLDNVTEDNCNECEAIYKKIWGKINEIDSSQIQHKDEWMLMVKHNATEVDGRLNISQNSLLNLFIFGKEGSELIQNSSENPVLYQHFFMNLAIIYSNLIKEEKEQFMEILAQKCKWNYKDIAEKLSSEVMKWLVDDNTVIYPENALMNISEFMANKVLVIKNINNIDWLVCLKETNCPNFDYLHPELKKDNQFADFKVFQYKNTKKYFSFSDISNSEPENNSNYIQRLIKILSSLEKFRGKYLTAIDRYPLAFFDYCLFIGDSEYALPLIPYYFVPQSLCFSDGSKESNVKNTIDNYISMLINTLERNNIEVFSYFNDTKITSVPNLKEYVLGDGKWIKDKCSDLISDKSKDNNYCEILLSDTIEFINSLAEDSVFLLTEYEHIIVKNIIRILNKIKTENNKDNCNLITFLEGYIKIKATYAKKFSKDDGPLVYMIFNVENMDLLQDNYNIKTLEEFFKIFKLSLEPQPQIALDIEVMGLFDDFVKTVEQKITAVDDKYTESNNIFSLYKRLDSKNLSSDGMILRYNSSVILGDEVDLYILDLNDINNQFDKIEQINDSRISKLISSEMNYINHRDDKTFIISFPDILIKVYETIIDRARMFQRIAKDPSQDLIYFQSFWRIWSFLKNNDELRKVQEILKNHRDWNEIKSLVKLSLWMASFNTLSLEGTNFLKNQIKNIRGTEDKEIFLYKLYNLILCVLSQYHSFSVNDIKKFIDNLIDYLSSEDYIVFHYQCPNSHNGFYSLINKENCEREIINRVSLDNLINNCNKANKIVLVNDTMISGTQFSNALDYYTNKETGENNTHYYNIVNENDREIIKAKFQNAKEIIVLAILMTPEAKNKIKDELNKLNINPDNIEFKYCYTVEKYLYSDIVMTNSQNKKTITYFLTDKTIYNKLFDQILIETVELNHNEDTNRNVSNHIKNANMILRYRRLPTRYIKMFGVKLKNNIDALFEYTRKDNI